MSTIADFTGYPPTWCPGCGNHGIGVALKSALVSLELSPSSVMVVFGIGCSGNMNDFLNAYAIHSLHGRAIPNAVGIKLANHNSNVIVIAGDGDCYGEGGNHLIHAARGNHDITVLVHDNNVYGLTTGQVAPTAPAGFKSKSTPTGIIEVPVNPLALGMTQGASFVAQAYAGNVPQLTKIIKQAISHRGFSLVNIIQPCVTFNKINTYKYYQEKVYELPVDYQKNNLDLALTKALEVNSEKFPLGILYEIVQPTYTDCISQLKDNALIKRNRFIDFGKILSDFI